MAMVKRQGALVYDSYAGRYDVRFGLDEYFGGLHCGNSFEVRLGNKWIATRIEMDEDWYLVGIKVHDLRGLMVRI